MTSANHQIRLAARPTGMPKPSDWELTSEPVPAPDTSASSYWRCNDTTDP